MYLPQQSFQWSTQLSPSVTNSYDQQERFERGVKNTEGKSRLRGPIPADPGYGHEVRPSSAPCGVGRVLRLHGSDAKAIYKRANANEGAPFQLHFQPSISYHKAEKPPKNHMNENMKRIRRIMRETQQRQEVKSKSKPVPVKALWQSKQYNNVQSKVKQKLEDNQRSSARSQSVQGNFLRAHANTGPEKLRSQSVASSVDVPITEVDNQTKPDYVKINSQYVKNIPQTRKTMSVEAVKQAREKQEKNLKNYQEKRKGRVPNYIEKIKEKRDQDISEARANEPDPDCPPDHIKVDNNQRVSTLQQLQFNREQLEKRLSSLPVHHDTVAIRRTKDEIVKKILELDEAIQIFSKPKVFLKIDE